MNTKLFRTIEFSISVCLLLARLRPFPTGAQASAGGIDIESIEAYLTDQVRVDGMIMGTRE